MDKLGVLLVIDKGDIARVKNLLSDNLGSRVRITAKKGRKRVVVRHGFIQNTYPAIFTMVLDNISEFADGERTVSFSYADILTKSIEITILDSKMEVV